MEVEGLVVSGSDDGTIRVFDLIRQTCVHLLRDAHPGGVARLLIVPPEAIPPAAPWAQRQCGVLVSGGNVKKGVVKVRALTSESAGLRVTL